MFSGRDFYCCYVIAFVLLFQFDEAIVRFQAMNASHYEHFRPTWNSFKKGILFCIVPIAIFGFAMKYERDTREKQIRTGQIAYRDRRFKFI